MSLPNSQPAIPEAAIEAAQHRLRQSVIDNNVNLRRLAEQALAAAIPHLFAPTSPPRDRGKMVKPMPGAPAGGYPVAAAEPATAELVERLRAHARMIGMMVNPKTNRNSSADLINEAIAALTADDRIAELERERDEAREYGKQARLRENAAEDARIHEHDLRVAAEAEVSRLMAAFRDISSFSPEPASHIGPFEQIARHARATTLAALSNQAGASKWPRSKPSSRRL